MRAFGQVYDLGFRLRLEIRLDSDQGRLGNLAGISVGVFFHFYFVINSLGFYG